MMHDSSTFYGFPTWWCYINVVVAALILSVSKWTWARGRLFSWDIKWVGVVDCQMVSPPTSSCHCVFQTPGGHQAKKAHDVFHWGKTKEYHLRWPRGLCPGRIQPLNWDTHSLSQTFTYLHLLDEISLFQLIIYLNKGLLNMRSGLFNIA